MEATKPPMLIRALSVSDLTWLYVAAVVTLNIIPVVAAEEGRALWLWLAAILFFFFVPKGIAVLELAERMPGEGGLHLWAKENVRRLFRFPMRLVLLLDEHVFRSVAPVLCDRGDRVHGRG